MKAMPQLAFDGDCREAFEFYRDLLRGEITVMNALSGEDDAAMPPGCSPGERGSVRFAELRIGDHAILGNDVPHADFVPMRGFHIALHLDTVSEARRVFDALARGGRVTENLAAVPWSPAFGIVTDRYGVPWLVLALSV